MRLLEQLVSVAIIIGVLYFAFAKARRRASDSNAKKRASLITNALLLAAGLGIAFLLPMVVPDTPGSPAALVMYLLCWLIGGLMAVFALVAFAGSWLGRPKD